MATVEDDEPAADASTWGDTDLRFGLDQLTVAVTGIVVVALLLRFVALGERTAHWDEARVAWWTLDYMRTGAYEYRAITHGPFYHHVNRVVFAIAGISDAAMRFAPALVGGLLPLSALGLRHRLTDREVLALAGFLAVNPILLYYSRFMRGDPLVAGVMFVAFVAFVRALDFESVPAMLAGFGLVALGFTIKGNAILYLATWAGASVLLLDQRLFRAADRGQEWTAVLETRLRSTASGFTSWLPWFVVGVVEAAVILVWFFAPRASAADEAGLNNVVRDPSLLSAVLHEATVGTYDEFARVWLEGDMQDHAYLPYLGHYLETLAWGALVLCLLALVGFLVDRYAGDGPRDLVAFSFYCGFASVLGYPIATDIMAPWSTIHAVVPLAIPAAVGLRLVSEWVEEVLADDDLVSAGITAAIVLVMVGYVTVGGAWMVYLAPQDSGNQLVQYAQPGDNLQPALDRMEGVSGGSDGPDVILYGENFVDDEPQPDGQTPACASWFDTLPLPWYFAAYETDVECAANSTALYDYGEEQPPIVIAHQSDASDVRGQFPDYWTATYQLRTTDTETTFFFRPDVASNEAAQSS